MPKVTSELLDRVPPQNLDAERGVLGSIFLDARVFDDVADVIRAVDFYVPAHALLYRHFLEMVDERKPIDSITVLQRLREDNDLVAVGGVEGLEKIVRSVPYAANAVYYAKIVREKAKLRNIIDACKDGLQLAYNDTRTADEILEEVELRLSRIKTGDAGTDVATMQEAVVDATVMIDKICERKKGCGLMVGIPAFDQQVGGLFPGELTILAARPSQGKTALALDWACWAACHGHKGYFATLEMKRAALALRRICSLSKVSLQQVRTGDIQPDDIKDLNAASIRAAQANLILHDSSRLTANDIRRGARRHKVDFVVVDYLQLIKAIDERPKRYEQIGETCRALKGLAEEMDIPVLVLAQLNRQLEIGSRPRPPRLGDLRESGDIEQDADLVLLLHRPEGGCKGVNGDKTDRDADLIVAKNRQGARPTIRLNWLPERTMFVDPYETVSF